MSDIDQPYPEALGWVVQAQGPGAVTSGGAFSDDATGPTVTHGDGDGYLAKLTAQAEALVPLEDRYLRSDFDYDKGYVFRHKDLVGCKLLGQCQYLGRDTEVARLEEDPKWFQLLQLAPEAGYYDDDLFPNFLPFGLELGEYGILNVFLRTDLSDCRMIIQRP